MHILFIILIVSYFAFEMIKELIYCTETEEDRSVKLFFIIIKLFYIQHIQFFYDLYKIINIIV